MHDLEERGQCGATHIYKKVDRAAVGTQPIGSPVSGWQARISGQDPRHLPSGWLGGLRERNFRQMRATSYQPTPRLSWRRAEAANGFDGMGVMIVRMSTLDFGVPARFSILSSRWRKPSTNDRSYNCWLRCNLSIIPRFAAYCDDDVGCARHWSGAKFSPRVKGPVQV